MRKRSSSESSLSTFSFTRDIDILTLHSMTVPPSSNWTDKIINTFRFAEKRRKLLIDTDGQSQLISVEESHKRLLWIGFGLATILLIIANILIGIYINERSSNKSENSYIPFPMSNSIQSKPIPKMVLWDMMGHGNVYKYILLKNLSFVLDWSIKLPSSSHNSLYHSVLKAKFIGYS